MNLGRPPALNITTVETRKGGESKAPMPLSSMKEATPKLPFVNPLSVLLYALQIGIKPYE